MECIANNGANGEPEVTLYECDCDECRDLAAQADAMFEGPTCSLCDGLGHGYPGAGPCPLEERGYDDGFEEWEARRLAI